jgi:vitamin B12 transporter
VPKLGLLWHAGETLDIKHNYFRSFKYPDFEDLFWEDATSRSDPDLRNEDGWGTDLGFAWHPAAEAALPVSALTLGGTVFAQWTTDSIHWYPTDGGIWRPQNVGEAAFFGLDSRLAFDIPLTSGPVERLGVSLSYQYLTSYLLCYGYTWKDEKRIPYQPSHTVGLSLEVPWTEGSARLSGHYEGVRYGDTNNLRPLEPYFLLGIEVNQGLGQHLAAFLSVQNLLNRDYETYADYPMPGLTVTVGVKVHT